MRFSLMLLGFLSTLLGGCCNEQQMSVVITADAGPADADCSYRCHKYLDPDGRFKTLNSCSFTDMGGLVVCNASFNCPN